MATLRLRLTRLSVILGVLLASCASAPKVPPEYSGIPDPALTESVRTDALGVSVFAFSQGPEDAEILILNVHGWGASGAEGLVFGDALLREAASQSKGAETGEDGPPSGPSIRFLSPDLPGSGASGKPDAPYTPPWFAEVMDAFRERVGRDRIVLAGHSLGGRIALEYALRYPEHIEALILLAPAGLTASFRGLDRWAMSSPLVVRAGSNMVSERLYLRFYRKRAVHDPRYVYPKIAQWAMDGLLTPEGKRAFQSVTGNTLAAPDLTDRLEEVRVPTLLIWGKDDRVLKFETNEIFRERLPDLRGFLAVDECGHLPQTEHAVETASAVYEFLKDLRTSASGKHTGAESR